MKTTYNKKRKAIRAYRMFELKWMLIRTKRLPLTIKYDLFGDMSNNLKAITV
ncbi:hypothetical protein J2X97_000385 [Epilithonimonas hungarica]|uniref:hypothetical protein n=1 Tax=Epilithonimonas hungarica TaxID=454006 RepID=UPI00277E20D7|nr:hypothetical protein [Epilithonimonas hungarica]MDP9954748.1 hypothetical protein [Epilithonimonas hungarica]